VTIAVGMIVYRYYRFRPAYNSSVKVYKVHKPKIKKKAIPNGDGLIQLMGKTSTRLFYDTGFDGIHHQSGH
jgi:hypothetical protein